MNLSFEGLLGLVGAVLIAAGFPVLLFGDYSDPEKKPTKGAMLAACVTGLGLICIAIPFLVIGARIIRTAIFGN